MTKPLKTIGVLGGMGPNASADFVQRMLKCAQRDLNAVQDDEYPPIILQSIGLKGFSVEGVMDMDVVRTQLLEGVTKLQQSGADFIVIPCNTVHCFYSDMVDAVQIPILNIAELTAKVVATDGLQEVGLCGSVTTMQTGIYHYACRKNGVKVIFPSHVDQSSVNTVIDRVMSGQEGEYERVLLKMVVLKLAKRGAEGVILGCTELPLAINQQWTDVLLYDSLQILAEAAVRKSAE